MAQIKIIGAKVQGTQVGTMVTITMRVIMSEMETTTVKNNFNMGNYGNINDSNGPYVPPQNREVTPRMVEIVWPELRICSTK